MGEQHQGIRSQVGGRPERIDTVRVCFVQQHRFGTSRSRTTTTPSHRKVDQQVAQRNQDVQIRFGRKSANNAGQAGRAYSRIVAAVVGRQGTIVVCRAGKGIEFWKSAKSSSQAQQQGLPCGCTGFDSKDPPCPTGGIDPHRESLRSIECLVSWEPPHASGNGQWRPLDRLRQRRYKRNPPRWNERHSVPEWGRRDSVWAQGIHHILSFGVGDDGILSLPRGGPENHPQRWVGLVRVCNGPSGTTLCQWCQDHTIPRWYENDRMKCRFGRIEVGACFRWLIFF
mmetsp:Transcript_10592/g.30980  ORF Transcript_10592/g.30980 Transcript_10592/m.30980 type:complete len:283 (-) Transcript_10592:75-923(-)